MTEPIAQHEDQPPRVGAAPSDRSARRAVLISTIGTAFFAMVILLAITRWALRETTPLLTDEALAAAEAQWKADGPPGYDMEIEIGGDRAGIVRIEVRDGKVTSMQRDGKTPAERTWDVWSVPGMFDMLIRNLQIASDPTNEINADPGTQWILHAEFHPRFGYPMRYRQVVIGTGSDVSWEVRRFRIAHGP